MMGWIKRHQWQLCIFLALLFCYGYFFPRWASWSQNSRLDLTMAIVDDRTLHIDRYYENTGDYAYFEGHYYSDKAPGLAFLGVPFYALFRSIATLPLAQQVLDRASRSGAFEATLNDAGTGLRYEKVYFAAALYFVTFFTVSIPAALLGVLIYNLLGRLRPDQLNSCSRSKNSGSETSSVPALSGSGTAERTRFWVTLVYGLATPAFAYGGMLFSHQLVAFLLFAAFYLAMLQKGQSVRRGLMFLVGLSLGWAVMTEYPAVLIAAAVALYALYTHPSPKTVVWGVGGALIPLGLLAAHDWAIFHSILPKGYLYSVNYHHLHDVGVVSITHPRPQALWGITFSSYRGLFFLSPILLLTLVGMVTWFRRKAYRVEWLVCLWAMVSFLLFYGSSIMWEGGFAVGPRYLLPMVPFMLPGMAIAWATAKQSLWGRMLLGVLSAWSVGVVWLETISGQSFPDWTANPLFNYSLPKFLSGDIARNLGMMVGIHGHMSLLPLSAALIGLSLLSFFAFGKHCEGEL